MTSTFLAPMVRMTAVFRAIAVAVGLGLHHHSLLRFRLIVASCAAKTNTDITLCVLGQRATALQLLSLRTNAARFLICRQHGILLNSAYNLSKWSGLPNFVKIQSFILHRFCLHRSTCFESSSSFSDFMPSAHRDARRLREMYENKRKTF